VFIAFTPLLSFTNSDDFFNKHPLLARLNHLKSTKLYQKASQEDVQSMYQLGLIYFYGDGKNFYYNSEDGKDEPVKKTMYQKV